MNPQPGERLYLIVDETKTAKRAKKMECVARHYNPSQKTYAAGHTVLRSALVFRGVRIPWRISLMQSKGYCRRHGLPYQTLTARAARIIRQFVPPLEGLDVVVLADSYYCCGQVVEAAEERVFGFIAPAKGNRRLNLVRRGHRPRIDRYGANVLRRRGRTIQLGRGPKARRYRIAAAEGFLKKMGHVFVTFSRRRRGGGFLSLVSNDPALTGREAVAAYENRWQIELLIKEEKQNLGWSHYQMLTHRSIVRHMHICAAAHVLLIRQGLEALGEKAKKKQTVLRLPGLGQLQDDLRRRLWRQAAQGLGRLKRPATMLRKLEERMWLLAA